MEMFILYSDRLESVDAEFEGNELNMAAKIWAVIPAGGAGTRMAAEQPKQYLMLYRKPMIEHTLTRLAGINEIDRLVVGIAKSDTQWQELDFPSKQRVTPVEAGRQRVDTVENCLRYIVRAGGRKDWALVHDAARPCVRPMEIRNLLKAVIQTDSGGLLALPMSDTLKRGIRVDVHSVRAIDTIPRENLWRAMTPQMFKVGSLLSAIEYARQQGIEMTDEASAMEATGMQPLLIPCSPDNIKITLPNDIQFAEMIIKAQEKEEG